MKEVKFHAWYFKQYPYYKIVPREGAQVQEVKRLFSKNSFQFGKYVWLTSDFDF